MPRLMVTDCYRDRLIKFQDFEENITTADVEQYTREVLHHRGRIKEKGIRDGRYEWWVCGADGKPVYILFQARETSHV